MQVGVIRQSLLNFLLVVVHLFAVRHAAAEGVHFTYLWHLEQPLYWPDQQASGTDRTERAWQSILRRDAGAAHPENDLRSIFGLDDRVAAYQYRPRDTVNAVSWTAEGGAQVSFSGGLIANIQSFAEAGGQLGYGTNWTDAWRQSRSMMTNASAGSPARPRMDIVLFSYHHGLLPLMDDAAIRMEIRIYKEAYPSVWGTSPGLSKGLFPSEMAFSERIIPVLQQEGIEWCLVSSEKIARAYANFPVQFGSGGVNCDPPNKADQINGNAPSFSRSSISRGCGPAEAVPGSYRPHRAKWVDPTTGAESSVTVVPCSQILGWEDGYAPLSLQRLQQLAPANDPARPMLVVLAHDGDNAWGGGYSYYMEAVPNFVGQASNAGFVPSVVQKYLDAHPVPASDLVHVEDGAWVNADGDFGAPQFLNWNYPPVNAQGQVDIVGGWAEDVRNWAVITAAQNWVSTAEAISTASGNPVRPAKVLNPDSATNAAERAWHFFLGSLNSGYMYYGTALDMEVKPTIACNEALQHATSVVGSGAGETTPPTIWYPQRWPWNPGSINYGTPYGYTQNLDDGDFTVWSLVHDVSGLESVTLKWRQDGDGENPLSSNQNETFAGGAEVGAWQSLPMTATLFPAGNIFNFPGINFFEMPQQIAHRVHANITGVRSALLDYYIEAVDTRGNVACSPIMHVWVGAGTTGGGGGTVVSVAPNPAQAGQTVSVSYNPTGRPLASAVAVNLYYGFNGWQSVPPATPMQWIAAEGVWRTSVFVPQSAQQLDMVFNNGSGVWDNNGGADWHFTVEGGSGQSDWVMDGQLDSDATMVAENGTRRLWAGLKLGRLYVAVQDAGGGDDAFVALRADVPGALQAAMWGKAGQVAAWGAFLAAENDNQFAGWFDAAGVLRTGDAWRSARGGSSGVLEGSAEVATLFGTQPQRIALSALRYATANAGVLRSNAQVPASIDGNGNAEAGEWILAEACAITVGGSCCTGDLNGSGAVDGADLTRLVSAWGTSGGDLTGDGQTDGADLASLLGSWGACR
jgi:hypothetical protein